MVVGAMVVMMTYHDLFGNFTYSAQEILTTLPGI
jgi:hypothetical protein